MNIFAAAQRLMSMDDSVWARHSSPLSVWTRFSCLPLLVLSIWSRVWIGWWSLTVVGAALWWIWYNPRAFTPPDSTDNWASKGTFGERVFLNRKNISIPAHHVRAAHVLALLSAMGFMPLVYGLIVLDVWAALCGVVAVVLSKVWFVDRMVWLYDDMKDSCSDYAAWLKKQY